MYFYHHSTVELKKSKDHARTLEEGQARDTTKFLNFTLTLKELTSSF